VRRPEFDHVIAAAANILGEDEFVVIGSQAILGTHPDPPLVLLESMEVDLYPRHEPARAIQVEGALGDGSHFHSTYGYTRTRSGPRPPPHVATDRSHPRQCTDTAPADSTDRASCSAEAAARRNRSGDADRGSLEGLKRPRRRCSREPRRDRRSIGRMPRDRVAQHRHLTLVHR
jgi:hypothetical protein